MAAARFAPASSRSTGHAGLLPLAQHTMSSSPDATLSIASDLTIRPSKPTDQRWPDVVPPHTALTFTAVFDQDEDIVSFRGVEFLDTEKPLPEAPRINVHEPDSPQDAVDAASTILSLDRLALPTGATMWSQGTGTGTMADFNSAFDVNSTFGSYLEATGAVPQTPGSFTLGVPSRHGHKPSTTNGDVDVYVPDLAVSAQQKDQWRKFSCQDGIIGETDLDEGFVQWAIGEGVRWGDIEDYVLGRLSVRATAAPPARRTRFVRQQRSDETDVDDEVTDEGFFESAALTPTWGRNGGLISHFSTTTTSTSNYVHVNLSDESIASSCWSDIEPPVVTPSFPVFDDPPPSPTRRLQKPRPAMSRRGTQESPPVVPVRPPPTAWKKNHSSISLATISSLRSRSSRRSAPSTGVPPQRPFISRARTLSFGASVRKMNADPDPEQWVCVDVERFVEVTEEITQRVLD